VKTLCKLCYSICLFCILFSIAGCSKNYPALPLPASQNSIKTVYSSAVQYVKDNIDTPCTLYEVTLSQNATEDGVITYTFKETSRNPKLHTIKWNPADMRLVYAGNRSAARGGYNLTGTLPIDQWAIDSAEAVRLAKAALLTEYTFHETSVIAYSSILNQEELKIIFTDAANQKYTATINPLTGALLTTYSG